MVSAPDATAPIGVFDSGLGGLTVVHELRGQLPDERLIYFGDTARVPYGPKSPDTVRRYAVEITEWLIEQGVKAVVVACNTATAHALPALPRTIHAPDRRRDRARRARRGTRVTERARRRHRHHGHHRLRRL